MTRRTRKIIFWILAFFFAVSTPLLIGYSKGYRIDWTGKKIVVTGSLFLKAKPAQARAFVNGKLAKETSFLWGTALISNLIPKTYEARLEKDGFWSWKKTLAIEPELVTEARNIILFSKNPVVSPVLEGAAAFWQSADGSLAFFLKKETTEGEKNSVQTEPKIEAAVYNLKEQTETPVKSASLVCPENGGQKETGCEIFWAKSNDKFLIHKMAKPERWHLAELGPEKDFFAVSPIFQRPYQTKNQLYEIYPIYNPRFNPENSNEIFYLQNSGLYRLNIENGVSQKVSDEKISAFELAGGFVYFLAEEKETAASKHPRTEINLLKATLGEEQEAEKINSAPLELPEAEPSAAEIKISGRGQIAFLANGALYYFNPETANFSLLAENVRGASFAGDGKKLLYYGENEINVYYLEKILIQPYKKIGEKSKIISSGEKIGKVLWFSDNEHIIFWAGKKIKIAEIDDRPEINIVDYVAAENPDFFYDASGEILYFAKNGTLFKTAL